MGNSKECCLKKKYKRDWPKVLDLAVMYLCNMPHSRSGYTPFELMFGTKNPNVIATLKSYWTTPSGSPVKITDYLENLQHNINTTLEGLKSDMADKVCLERSKLDKSNLRSFSVTAAMRLRCSAQVIEKTMISSI